MDLAGQSGIRFREALITGNLGVALTELSGLDVPHRVELILGAALRDGRNSFSAARSWKGASHLPTLQAITEQLMGEPDTHLDELAASYIANRKITDQWWPSGPLSASPVTELKGLIAQYQAGVGGISLVKEFRTHALFPSVYAYYTEGSIHALGPRPLLLLALTNGYTRI